MGFYGGFLLFVCVVILFVGWGFFDAVTEENDVCDNHFCHNPEASSKISKITL